MRILELFQPDHGGVPEHVRVVSERLTRRGHDVTVGGPPGASTRPAIEAFTRYVPLGLVARTPAPRADRAATAAVAKLLRRSPVDVVHVHGQKAGIAGRLAARRAGVPVVYTPHFFVYRSQLRRARPGARARRWLNLGVERWLGRHTAAIVACSEDEGRAALADRVVDAEHIEVVLYGVDPDMTIESDAALQRFRGDGPLLGFVAALRDQKGLPTLLDALDRLARRGAAPRFAIVGNGPLHDEVAARIAGGPLAATTLLAPFRGRVEPYLRAIDVFVLPSYWEGMPIAALEAMAAGLPVVASAVDGTPEAVDDGRTGFLVPSHDAAMLADRLGEIARDAGLRERMGAAGRADATARFTVERMVDELEALYERVAA